MKRKLKNEILELGNQKGLWSYRKTKLRKKDIKKFIEKVHWKHISLLKLSEEFIIEFLDHLNLPTVLKNNKVSEELLDKVKDSLGDDEFWIICRYQILSERFIEENKEKMAWYSIVNYQELSDEFMDKFSKRIDWKCASRYQKMGEDLMRKYHEKLDWGMISSSQTLSVEFIREFQDKINWLRLSNNKNIGADVVDEFYDKISWFDFLVTQGNKAQLLNTDEIRRRLKLIPLEDEDEETPISIITNKEER